MKSFVFIFSIIFPALAISQSLSGTIVNYGDRTVYLAQTSLQGLSLVDSTQVQNDGSFGFTIKDIQPGFYRLVLPPNPSPIQLILNNENVHLETVYPSLIDSLVISGSAENSLYYQFLAKNQIAQRKYGLIKELQRIYQNQSEQNGFLAALVHESEHIEKENTEFIRAMASQNPHSLIGQFLSMLLMPELKDYPHYHIRYSDHQAFLRHQFFENIDFTASWLIHTNLFENKYPAFFYLFGIDDKQAMQNAIDHVLRLALQNDEIYTYTVDYLLHFFEQRRQDDLVVYITENAVIGCENELLDAKVKEKGALYRSLATGKQAPELILGNEKGEKINLHKIEASGILLYFYASWCSHCQKALPELKSLYARLHEQGIEFIAVSIDENPDEWLEFIRKNDLNWVHLNAPEGWNAEIVRRYHVTSTPKYYLLDENKRISAKPVDLSGVAAGLQQLVRPANK